MESKNISIAVYDDVMTNIKNSNVEKVTIIRKNVVRQLQKNPSDRLVNDLLILCREKMNNKKPAKKSFLQKLVS